MAQESCSRFPMKDGPWLALMRVHQAMGEPRASLDVYREYLSLLEREGGTPSQEVTEYAAVLEHQRPPPRRPRLVGRERELEEMEAAYQARKAMFVFGEPGVGKSRLIEEFAASKGKWIALGAKPGDGTIPYASHVRNGHALLARRKEDGRPPLPAWVQEQLAHHLGGPELGTPRRADPPPQVTVAFLDAAAELLRDTCEDMGVVVFDDGQYIDPQSFELGMYIHNKLPSWNTTDGKPFPLIVNGYRSSAIQQGWLDIIRDLAHQGQVALIELQPLNAEGVAELLRGMNLPGLEEHAALLARYSGGNPLYLVEMVKTLRQEGWVPGTRLPYRKLAKSVKHLIRRRLTWLSPLALSIARVVAVAQANTSPEAVARVLGRSPAELVEAYRELEERGVLQGDWFTHDLFGEVILEDVPEALRDVLRPQGVMASNG